MKRRVAVFDIDGTIFRSSLLIELTEEMIAEGLFPENARRIYNDAHRDWLDRQDTYGRYIGAVVQAFERHIRGVAEKDFLRAVQKVARLHRHRVYRYTRDLVARLKRQGFFLLAISHSPKYIVDDFGKQLGFDKIYGRLFELDRHGKFTGKAFHLDLIDDKAKILRRAVAKEGLTLRGSVGVGDTESDIPFLKLVDRAICFNPNSKLFAAAKRNGWSVAVERKDVIYQIQN